MTNQIEAILFDMGGTLRSSVKKSKAEKRELIQRIIDLLGMQTPVDEFAALLSARAKDYKHWAEATLVELNESDLWTKWMLSDFPAEQISGIALETLIAQHLRAWNDYRAADGKLFYWRTKHGVEVDFIFYGNNEFTAIEVKSKTNVFEKDIRGLEIFGKDYPEAKLMLLYQGDHRLKIKNVSCIPVSEFLLNLTPNKSLQEI